jgi:hypothetical protein
MRRERGEMGKSDEQVGERTESEREEDSGDGDTLLGSPSEDGGKLLVGGHGDDHASSDPAVRVTGGPGRDENTSLKGEGRGQRRGRGR